MLRSDLLEPPFTEIVYVSMWNTATAIDIFEEISIKKHQSYLAHEAKDVLEEVPRNSGHYYAAHLQIRISI
jgi:hypothetical protein